ncbi:hypothetical protein EYF80_008651 [Liparis tanakae]|uniref:Uncharacterized protein n=1 Tax=Liparis tanakae TaxID=230148 RepID=A0A4Z2ISW4_9TELE|nr:hypothetical protein EYF80_008651 [Liparis tanakae]
MHSKQWDDIHCAPYPTHLCAVMPGGGGGGGGGGGSQNLSTSLLPPPPPRRQTPRLAYRIGAGPPPSSPISPSARPPPSLLPPLCPAHPGGLFSSPARANPRLGKEGAGSRSGPAAAADRGATAAQRAGGLQTRERTRKRRKKKKKKKNADARSGGDYYNLAGAELSTAGPPGARDQSREDYKRKK